MEKCTKVNGYINYNKVGGHAKIRKAIFTKGNGCPV